MVVSNNGCCWARSRIEGVVFVVADVVVDDVVGGGVGVVENSPSPTAC